ncbi:MAG TPA: isoprenylcysteine carboxyl methyltransferase family protein [Actinomycetes bacterium]|nr:isoprenylcysteine carboxyl methyltransferase family protein [Actinomycetes bacterium]
MTSTGWFILLVAAVGVERIVELIVSQRNIRWALERGGVEFGRGHYPAMVALHVALLGGSVLEVVLLDRVFLPWLGWPMLLGVLLAQGLRWWCIVTLGPQWNTRIVVVPGMSRVTAGPYRHLRHPNYVAVAVEGFCLPLVHTAWITSLTFTACNAVLMKLRIGTEERALQLLDDASASHQTT